MQKTFYLPAEPKTMRFIMKISSPMESMDFIVTVAPEPNDMDFPTSIANFETSLLWSPSVRAHYLYVPYTEADGWVKLKQFTWRGENRRIKATVRGWKKSDHGEVVEDFVLGIVPEWDNKQLITLSGEEQ